ncbi:NAD(P)-dependent oxidoreductase [Bacteroides acidifaciens]|nr:NAD(P)-dependent oxidoreductase [Bacteroides acidifaciens]
MKRVKKVVLTGASGFVGSDILNEVLNRGFEVTAVVRHPAKIKIQNENLKVVKVDVSSLNEVAEVCKGADAVISAFNPGWSNPNIYDETIKVYLTIVNGIKKAGINRSLMVGGAGSLFIAPGLRLMDSGEVPENILPGVKALGEFYLNFLKKEKKVDWVFFSPAADMRPGVRTGRYRLGKDDMIIDIVGNSHISVEDYAAAMIDELEHPKHHQERFTIVY